MSVTRRTAFGQRDQDATVWIVPLAQITARDTEIVGGKAANLGELIRAGLPVPEGFCVTTDAFRLWLGECRTAAGLLARLADLAPDQSREIAEVAGALRQTLTGHPLPHAVMRAIRATVQSHDPQAAWAVRSSATAEDSPQASFAGQHDTLLNVCGPEAVLTAVRRCWVSLFSDRAVAYRAKNRIDQRSAAMAVVVQQMVPADVSGVMFTADPVTGDARRVIIEGAFGLGEALVSGKVTPDRLVLDKDSLEFRERLVNPKTVAFVPRSAGGVEETLVPATHQTELCLDDVLARRLGELGRTAERHFGRSLDVEWAARDGQVFLLQARPITALSAPCGVESGIWTNANVVEALPDVVTPLSWSLMQVLLNDFLYPLMRRLGLDTEGQPLVDLIAGRAYLNVRLVSELVQKVAGPIRVDVAAAFGGQYGSLEQVLPPGSPRRPRLLGLRALCRLVKLTPWLIPGLFGQQRQIERWGQRVFGELAHAPASGLTDEQLAAHPAALLRVATLGAGNRTWAAAIWMAVGAVGGSTGVFLLARRWFGNAYGSLANRLIAGARGMNSAENGRELLRLAAWVRSQPELKRALLEPGSFAEIEKTVAKVPKGPDFLERWRTFMAGHGHQARGGMDIYQPRWSELPDFVLDMLRAYLQFDEASDPLSVQARQGREREALLADCLRRLCNPLKRWLFASLVRASRRGLAQRENVKNEGVRLVAILRRTALEAGRRLVARGVLREVGDVFFLRLEELGPALRGSPGLDVASVIAARKAEFAGHRLLSPPPLIVGRFDPGACAPAVPGSQTRTFHGVAVSPGLATGKARVILQADVSERLRPGEILVAPYTDPGWTPYFAVAAAIVVDVGGLLSHGSVVAREYGLPAVVNVGLATKFIKTGQTIRADGNRGVVTILEPTEVAPVRVGCI